MKLINSPTKPFPNYKWRWATFQPTESLNDPPVLLGALRVFNQFQNYAPNSTEVMDALGVVQKETNTSVDLVRTRERNLIRNSGQYWKALGLLEEAHGKILVSPFGKLLASGEITQIEFATTIIKTFELPNKRIDENATEWDSIGIKIKPLELILDILSDLSVRSSSNEAFISPRELVKIVIPLAGVNSKLEDYANSIIQHRKGLLDISAWPDCAPSSNDKRMAREFLLFLSNYGFCHRIQSFKGNENEKYFLAGISIEEVVELHELNIVQKELEAAVKAIRETQIPAIVERKRVTRELVERPYQNIFRKNILLAFNYKCVVTGVNLENVLEASHIIPVTQRGSDKVENGLCLRSDIHQLYDSGHLRLLPTGDIVLSEIAAAKNNYQALPKKINIPNFVNTDNLYWRVKYY